MSTTTIDQQPVPTVNRETTIVERSPKSIVVNNPASCMLWFGGWLFTIAFADLGFWKAVLALIIWPYFLGVLAR
jgi:hypothetical protein